MKKLSMAVLGAGALMASVSGAAAQDVEISGNVALTTNYVFRGITQSDDGPAVQGGFDVSAGGWYAGTWASSVDFGDDTTMELDVYGGYGGAITEALSYDVGVIYYAYPDSPELATGTQDFVELYGGLSYAFDAFEFGGSIAYSPDFYGETGDAFYYNVSASYPLTESLSVDASYGVSDFEEGMNHDYQDYSIGGTYASELGLDLGLYYYGTTNFDDNTSTVVFSVGKSL